MKLHNNVIKSKGIVNAEKLYVTNFKCEYI